MMTFSFCAYLVNCQVNGQLLFHILLSPFTSLNNIFLSQFSLRPHSPSHYALQFLPHIFHLYCVNAIKRCSLQSRYIFFDVYLKGSNVNLREKSPYLFPTPRWVFAFRWSSTWVGNSPGSRRTTRCCCCCCYCYCWPGWPAPGGRDRSPEQCTLTVYSSFRSRDLYGLGAISSLMFWIYAATTPAISCSVFTGVNNTGAVLSPLSLTPDIKPCSGFLSIPRHRRLICRRCLPAIINHR